MTAESQGLNPPRRLGLFPNCRELLPPRPAGVFACVDARPGLSVVVVAHAGLDRLVRVRDEWVDAFHAV